MTLNEREWPKVGFTREQGPVRPGHGWSIHADVEVTAAGLNKTTMKVFSGGE